MCAIDTLIAEHENVLRMTAVMKQACLFILEGGAVETGDFRQFIDFIRIYADKAHHGKEEAFLFQEMQEHLGSAGQTLVRNGMLVEHDLGRLYVKQLEDAVVAHEQTPNSVHKLAILTNSMAYADLLVRHIERENGAVFPFARRGLSQEVLELLNAQTARFEEENAAQRECQLAVLAALELKYAE